MAAKRKRDQRRLRHQLAVAAVLASPALVAGMVPCNAAGATSLGMLAAAKLAKAPNANPSPPRPPSSPSPPSKRSGGGSATTTTGAATSSTTTTTTGGDTIPSGTAPSSTSTTTPPEPSPYAADILVTLQNMARDGHDQATGGLWVNWAVSATGSLTTNYNGTGTPDAPAGSGARHDPATDLRYLHDLLTWQSQHPGDAQFAAQVSLYTSVVKQEFAHTKDLRGWYYDELSQIGRLSGDPWFTAAARYLAAAYAAEFNPRVGTIFQQDAAHPTGFYRVDWALEEGAALVEAGATFRQPTWVADGLSVLAFVRAHAYVAAQGTYLHAMKDILLPNGEVNPDEAIAYSDETGGAGGTVVPSEIAQDAVSLLEASAAANDSALLTEGMDLLGAFSPSTNTLGLWDNSVGGYFESIDFSGGSFDNPLPVIIKSGKKDPDQLAMLQAYHLADELVPSMPFVAVEQALLKVGLESFESSQSGYPFEETSGWQPVVEATCGCQEVWVTSQSDDIVLEALQAATDGR